MSHAWSSVQESPSASIGRMRGMSLLTLVGVVEGDVLDYVEVHGRTTLHRLVQGLEWPSRIIVMAVGALIRQGLIRGTQTELEVVLGTHETPGAARVSRVSDMNSWAGPGMAHGHP